jgi:CRISPR-associated protein Cas2
VAELLEGYGRRVQYSVFECVLAQSKYIELQKRLKKQVNLAEDNLRFYPLSRHTWGSVEIWGQGPEITEYPSSIII